MDIAHISATGLCYLCCFLVISWRMGWKSPKIHPLKTGSLRFQVGISEGCPPFHTTRKMATSHREFLMDDRAGDKFPWCISDLENLEVIFSVLLRIFIIYRTVWGGSQKRPQQPTWLPRKMDFLSSPASWRTWSDPCWRPRSMIAWPSRTNWPRRRVKELWRVKLTTGLLRHRTSTARF